jgi:hypothetical protein
MIHKDIQILDLGAENWSRLSSLSAALPRVGAAMTGKGPLLLIYRGMKLLKAVDLGTRLPVEVDFMGTSRLEALARESGFDRVIALEDSALARIAGHAQRRMAYDDDLLRQVFALLHGLAAEWRRTVFTYPEGPRRIPVIPYPVVERLVGWIVPDDTLTLIAVTEGERAWASLVIGYRGGEFWLLSSLDALGSEEADLSEEGLKSAAESLEARFGGKVRAIVVERDACHRILESRLPAGALLWAGNTSELRLLDVPLRWKALALAAALVPRARSDGV